MRIELLGPLRVLDRHGEPLSIGGRPRALLIRLALEPGQVVGFGTLVEDLWADELPADPAGALHTVVARLRRAVGRDVIGSHPAGYRLDLPRTAVDAAVFEDFVAAGRAAGDPMRLLAALALWRGEPVPEVASSGFGPAAVARWTELRLAAVEAWAEVAPADDVLPELTELNAAHPLRESLAARLILVLCRAGRRPDALLVFDRTRRLLADELGVDPGAELRAAHLEALRTDVPLPPKGHLPARLTSFLGRDAELARVRELLGRVRLVTLTGFGGVGKTRLAIEVAAGPAGGWLVELAALDPATGETGIAEAMLAALGARTTGPAPGLAGSPRERLLHALAGQDLLLVLDNCEHVLDATARLVHELLTRSPGLRVLATSREPLGITGEVSFPVSPLRAEDDAVALFADRAAAARGGRFALADRAVVAQVCRELDGIPLAIELAAARLRTMSLRQLADGLSDRFRLLDRGSRVAQDRHRTLRSVVDWSWELLTGVEQTLLRRLSVFAGGASLAAAEAVCGVAGVLESLVDKSLVVLGDESDGRYRLLATVAEYAAGRLAAAGEAERFRVAHAEYFLELAETAEPLLRGPEQLRWLAELDAERDNLDAAIRFAVRSGRGELALRLVAARAWAWFIRGQGEEAAYWAAAALPVAEIRKGHAFVVCSLLARGTPGDEDFADHPALLAASMMGHLRSTADLPALRQYTVDTANRVAASADPWQAAAGQLLHGVVQAEFTVGGVPRAEEPLRAAVEKFRAVGDRWGMMYAHYELSTVLENRGDYAGAVVALDESRRLAEEFGGGERLPTPVLLLVWSALLRIRAGQLDQAAAELDLAGRVALRLDNPAARARVAHVRGLLAAGSGAHRRALECHRAAWEFIRDRPPGRGLSVQLTAMVASDLALAEAAHGNPGRARPLFELGLRKLADTLDGPARAYPLERAAAWCADRGGYETATKFLAAATAARGLDEVATPALRALTDRCAEALGEQGFRAAWHDGQGLTHPETLPLPTTS